MLSNTTIQPSKHAKIVLHIANNASKVQISVLLVILGNICIQISASMDVLKCFFILLPKEYVQTAIFIAINVMDRFKQIAQDA